MHEFLRGQSSHNSIYYFHFYKINVFDKNVKFRMISGRRNEEKIRGREM